MPRHCRRAGPVPCLRPGGRLLASSSPRGGSHPSPASSVTRCLLLAAYAPPPQSLASSLAVHCRGRLGSSFSSLSPSPSERSCGGPGSWVAAAPRAPGACSARPSSDHGSRETMCRPCGLCRAQNHAYQPPAAPLSCAVFLVTTGRHEGHTLITLYFILHQVRTRRSTSPSHVRWPGSPKTCGP